MGKEQIKNSLMMHLYENKEELEDFDIQQESIRDIQDSNVSMFFALCLLALLALGGAFYMMVMTLFFNQ